MSYDGSDNEWIQSANFHSVSDQRCTPRSPSLAARLSAGPGSRSPRRVVEREVEYPGWGRFKVMDPNQLQSPATVSPSVVATPVVMKRTATRKGKDKVRRIFSSFMTRR